MYCFFFSYFPRSQPTNHSVTAMFRPLILPSNPVHCLTGFRGLGGPMVSVQDPGKKRAVSLRMTFSESFAKSTCQSDECIPASHQHFFFLLCNLICSKSKQCSSASKNMYEWVCVYKGERDKHSEGRGRKNWKKSSNQGCSIFQASFGLFFIRELCLFKSILGDF